MKRGLCASVSGATATSAAAVGWALVLGAFASALEPPAHAAEPAPGPAPTAATVHLEYQREPGAASCVSAEQLARDVEARLGRRVFVTRADAELTARLRARRLARRFVVEIELFDRTLRSLGRRELSTRGAHCSSLDDSLALVLALAADMPHEPAPAPLAPTADARARAPSQVLPTVSLGSALSIPDTSYAPRLGMRLRPSLGAVAALGLVPSLAPGLELGLELRPNQFWPLHVQGAGFAEQSLDAVVAARGATFNAQTLLLGVCPWTGPLGRFELSVCVAQCFGRVRAEGVGFNESQRDGGWQLHAGAGLGISRAIGPLFVSASATLLVPVVRRRYYFTDGVDDITLYAPPWLAGLLSLRVGTEI